MKFFRQMDLYKAVVLATLLLLPVAGWWIQRSKKAIVDANAAVTDATKKGGLLEQIGTLLQQISTVEDNRLNVADATENPSVYFDAQFGRSAQGMQTNQFRLVGPTPEQAFTGSKQQQAKDYSVNIQFLSADFVVSRELLFAILYNCESGAKGEGEPVTSIWKLRALQIRNEAVANSRDTPPTELPDRWRISKLEFVRREPGKL